MVERHGGVRKGAGRKKGYRKVDARRIQVAVRLNEDERKAAQDLGDGIVTKGIREALRIAGRGKNGKDDK